MYFEHPFAKDLNVYIPNTDDIVYKTLKDDFKNSDAFFFLNQKLVIINPLVVTKPWFTKEHMRVILAHELGHYMMGHGLNSHGNKNREIEADWLAYHILLKQGTPDDLSLMTRLLDDRYGIDPLTDKPIESVVSKIEEL